MPHSHHRRQLAEQAARILLEGGTSDYGLAKRKAAEQTGLSLHSDLPTNQEVEELVQERYRLFTTPAAREKVLWRLRTALQIMEVLDFLNPRLVGPLLQGIPEPSPDVRLHGFAETVEEVIFALEDRGISCRAGERRYRDRDSRREQRSPFLRFTGPGKSTVEITLFPVDGIRQSPPSPIDGRPMRRIALPAVRELLEEQEKIPL